MSIFVYFLFSIKKVDKYIFFSSNILEGDEITYEGTKVSQENED